MRDWANVARERALAAAGVGTWSWRIDTGEITWDGGVEAVFGLPLGSSIHHFEQFLSFIHPEDREAAYEQIEQSVRTRADLRIEYRVLWPDGSVHWVESRGRVWRENDDGPLCMLGTASDITGRRREEEARLEGERKLRTSENRLRTFMQTTPGLVFVIDAEGRYLEVFANLDGRFSDLPARLQGRRVHDVMPERWWRPTMEVMASVLETGQPAMREFPLREGEELAWFEGRVMPVPWTGADDAVVWVAQDITERKRALRALQESEDRYRRVVSSLAEGVILFDGRFKLLAHNTAALEILGLDQERLGRADARTTDWRVESEDGRTLSPEEFPSTLTLRDGIPRHDQVLRLVRPDGERVWISGNYVQIPSAGHRGQAAVVCSFSDITERRKFEVERETIMAELEAKNEELERFAFTVSHDLKSPLITVRGYLSLLERDFENGNRERVLQDIAFMRGATDKMQRLLGELLQLSRVGSKRSPHQPCSLSDIVRDAVERLDGSIREAKARVEVEPDLPTVAGESVRLLEVFQNLIDNAIKYTRRHAEPVIQVGTRRDGDQLVFFVRDNGPGIAPAYHERVFRLFERLDTEGEGTGVGLALVRRIVEMHDGRVWVESDGEGHGSTFAFTLHEPGLAGRSKKRD